MVELGNLDIDYSVLATMLWWNYIKSICLCLFLQRAQWTFRNLLTWQEKEREKSWTTRHSSKVLLQLAKFIYPDKYNHVDLFNTSAPLLCSQRIVTFFMLTNLCIINSIFLSAICKQHAHTGNVISDFIGLQ